MPVYIDPPRWPAHGTEFSHLVSDTSLDELHEAAARIGLSPRAFDRDHYDVPRERYDDAVAAGAVEVDGKELVRVLVASGLRVTAAQRNNKVLTALRQRWDSAVGQVPEADEQSRQRREQLREQLLEAWGEDHRHYHDRTHLLAVLRALDELTDDDATPPLEVVLAAWFHDVVYEGQAGADEEASAQLAEQVMPQAGFSEELTREVARLVRVTAHHNPVAEDHNGALISDADLAVLGSDPAGYADYVRRVREEYSGIPEFDFVHARLMILDRMDPQNLYTSDRARTLWGRQAQENLSVEIDELRLGSLARIQVPDWCKVLSIVGVCFVNDGQLLTVRKRDTNMFMLVGGKREDEESAPGAALRETHEEIGLELTHDSLTEIGRFSSPAANEAATWIDTTVFLVDSEVAPAADTLPPGLAEIEELRYLDLSPESVEQAEATLAPLVRRQVVPVLRRRDRRFWPAYTAPEGPYRLENGPED
ncbi:DUF4031 domain-containing protein [Kocuria sp. JC486]|uniref:DUF4031 domain-containing protein n=1 Tax=Kocuria sp. JC486 TaxID=1970736 RepID=UPI001ADD8035